MSSPDGTILSTIRGIVGSPISRQANANGRYVAAENAGSSPLIANRTAIGTWEKFYRTTG